LNSSVIKEFLLTDEFIEKAIPHLPEGQQSKEYYMKNVASPQFHEALNSLTSALNSENFALILNSFGLNTNDTKNLIGVEGLINALLKKYAKKD
jgi:hypothetical protein